MASPRREIQTGMAGFDALQGRGVPVRVARRRESEEEELPQGRLLNEGSPVLVKRLVAPAVARGPSVVSMAVAGVDAEAGGAWSVSSVA